MLKLASVIKIKGSEL